MKTVLFPSDVFDLKTVDPDLKQEYEAVLDTGLFQTILFSYDDWFNKGKLRLTSAPDSMTDAVYRGWMMKPEQYRLFYAGLLGNNIRLVTDPEMYERFHVFPNIYPDLQEDTARILTFPLHSQINLEEVIKTMPRFMVKDYVKSVKGTEFPTYFDEKTTQDEFDRWMEVFYHYRDELVTGGICVKEYLDLRKYDGKTNEYRVFYINHVPVSITRNSLLGDYIPELPRELAEKYRNLGSIFYTIDFAELADGSWKIIEAGDGSVSGLSAGQDNQAFFRALYHSLND